MEKGGVESFVEVIEDMASSPIVMSAKKIKTLLKCLAYYGELRAAVELARQNFDFEDSMKRSYMEVGASASFRMPTRIKEKVAIVVCLLLEFDLGKRDFYDFILKCYPAENAVESYHKFVLKVLRPFKEALLKLVEAGDVEDTPSKLNEIDFTSDGLQNQTEYCLLQIVEKVNVATINESDRQDLLKMLEGFAAAIDTRDSLMIHAMWIGLKRTLSCYKMCSNEIKKLEEALRLYLIVK